MCPRPGLREYKVKRVAVVSGAGTLAETVETDINISHINFAVPMGLPLLTGQ